VRIEQDAKSFQPFTVVVETAQEANMLRSLTGPVSPFSASDWWGVANGNESPLVKIYEAAQNALEPFPEIGSVALTIKKS
jgi:hypothetical protein